MEQNNNEKEQLIKLGAKAAMKSAMAPVKALIASAVITVLPYILVGIVALVVILCVYFGTLEQIDKILVESENWGERIGNVVSLHGFRTNEELDKDEEGKFFYMLDLYKEVFKFNNYELSMITQTLLYEGSNEERIYLSEKPGEEVKVEEDTEANNSQNNNNNNKKFDFDDFKPFTLLEFIKNILTNYQRGFLSSYGGQSQYLKANKNLFINAVALKKCSNLTQNNLEAEKQCYKGYLVAEYNIVTDHFIDCKPGDLYCVDDNKIETDVEEGFLVLYNNIFGESAGLAGEIIPVLNSIKEAMATFSIGIVGGNIVKALDAFRENMREALTLFALGKLADADDLHFYYDGYIVKNLKEEYKVRKNTDYDDEDTGLSFERIFQVYNPETIRKERKNRRKTANTILDLVEAYFDLTYGSNRNIYKNNGGAVIINSEANTKVSVNIDGEDVDISFDDYVMLTLLDLYGDDILNCDDEFIKAAIISARTKAYSNSSQNGNSMNLSSNKDFSSSYDIYSNLTNSQRSSLSNAVSSTSNMVIKGENGKLNNNFSLNTSSCHANGSTASEIIEQQGGNVEKKDPYSSPVPSVGDLRNHISADYQSIDSAHPNPHGGVDFGRGQSGISIEGENVVSVVDGTVYYTNDSCSSPGYVGSTCGGGYGNYVVIQSYDANGTPYYTYYAHMAYGSVSVQAGQTIKAGTKIGNVGHTGSSDGPHLHLEVRYNGNEHQNRRDPLEFFGL